MRRSTAHTLGAALLAVGALGGVAGFGAGIGERSVSAAELQSKTTQAFEAYLGSATQAFLSRVRLGSGSTPATVVPAGGAIHAGPGREDGIVNVPDGLVHHWRGNVFVSGVSLSDVLAASRDYADYAKMYSPVIASELLESLGDTYKVLIRVKEGEAGVSAVLQIRSTVTYVGVGTPSVHVISTSEEVREVKDAGRADERLLPAGRDSGYLWRANTFSHFVARANGVQIEMETLGLSRAFPPFLGWFIEPIARRLGRKSIELSLREFVAAIRKRHPQAAVHDPAFERRPDVHGPSPVGRTSRPHQRIV